MDAQEIKARIDILDIFKRDGHELKRSGSNFFCLCPFHEETKPSCSVSESKQVFRCFGCDRGGDVISYWQWTRGCSFPEALKQLAEIAGISTSSDSSWRPARKQPHKRPKPPEEKPSPLSNKELTTWSKSCQLLANSPEEINRIATWRGISPELVQWMANTMRIGTMNYMNAPREAFIVKAPINKNGNLASTSVHIRLAPNSPGNFSDKASWRFSPKGQKSWPFILGSPVAANTIYLTEGQWDAIALCELMKWHQKPEIFNTICVLGLRGAASGRLLDQYPFKPTATLIAFADSDDAGEKWFEPDGLLDQLSSKVKRVYGFKPDTKNSDFNDRLKEGLTKEQLLTAPPDYPVLASLGVLNVEF